MPYHQPQVPTTSQIYSLPITNTPTAVALTPTSCRLNVRQQPKEALLTVKGKEKFRKPLDPPPMLQLHVNSDTDPNQQFLQNPYLFVSVSLYKHDKDEPIEGTPSDTMAGTLVSSLHRLKDVDNKDGAFFIFGDISIKVQGWYRLRFTLYELQPTFITLPELPGYQGIDPSEMLGTYQCLGHAYSEKFQVVPPKDFKGLEESTYLSRAFSDQGVRLRLRKEARGMMSNKRSIGGDSDQPPIAKKRREDSVESANPLMPNFTYGISPYPQPQYLQTQPLQTPTLQTPTRQEPNYWSANMFDQYM
uniref:VosA n=1 Tax=Cochliobolus lunatus TaxID=5503 RepID=A0A1W5X9C1_COCLU|nr:VosA [Curvularia lunata]